MRGEIVKIDKIQKSRNSGDEFIRVFFKLGGQEWIKMDLVPTFRNFKRWKQLLQIGNFIDNLKLKDKKTIDADSFPILRKRMDLTFEDEQLLELSKNCL